MATVGSVSSEASTPGPGWAFQGLNVNTQAWSSFTMPTPGGRITTLHAYFDAQVTSGNGELVLWDSGGNVLATVGVNGIAAGSDRAGGQAWHHANLAGYGVYVKGGSTISIGFWMPSASGFVTSMFSGGASRWNGQGYSGPGNQSGSGSTGYGNIGAYADYVPCLRKVRRGGAWVESPKRTVRSGVVVLGPRYIWRGGVWSQVQ